jgi:CYTH domain-containing protein
MPTENELKYVIKIESESQFSGVARPLHIWQGYPCAVRGMTVRVRKIRDGVRSSYVFTYKNNVGSRVIEIEQDIDERDYNDLWGQSLVRFEKVRYKYAAPYKGWEVDFFKDHGDQTYFAMAECEMPEGQMTPDRVPLLVKENLVFAVPATDERFSSKLLADPRYAKKLLAEVSGTS